jgi:putative transcriptional regulator
MIRSRVSETMGRERLNITDLARGAGISRNAAQAWYHGKQAMIDLSVLDRVCRFLEVQPGELFVFEPDTYSHE